MLGGCVFSFWRALQSAVPRVYSGICYNGVVADYPSVPVPAPDAVLVVVFGGYGVFSGAVRWVADDTDARVDKEF